ncbi:MAG: LapD/MoxY N-terminal periplasmic domain-containing protein, partial [Azovibrio sp.]
MTLSRQLWLAVITVAILAFTGSFFVSTVTAKNYLEDQLSIKNSDNAASLALSMSQSPKDMVTIELQVAAMYDSGQYALIRLLDPDDQIMIEKISH